MKFYAKNTGVSMVQSLAVNSRCNIDLLIKNQMN